MYCLQSCTMHLGLRIKIARISKGITQEQLAERINKTRPLISSIEQKGKANYYTLKSICDVLGLDINDIENEVSDVTTLYQTPKNKVYTDKILQLESDVEHLRMLVRSQQELIEALKEKITMLSSKKKK